MGTDIHTLVEKYQARGPCAGAWVTVNTMNYIIDPAYIRHDGTFTFAVPKIEQRDYELFAKLAGVRGPGPDPRGLPPDLSQTATYMVDRWGGDAHSHSWMLASELLPLLNAHYGENKYAPDYLGVDYDDDLDLVRLVFWFDN